MGGAPTADPGSSSSLMTSWPDWPTSGHMRSPGELAPDGGGQGEAALGDASADAAGGAGTMEFQVELRVPLTHPMS